MNETTEPSPLLDVRSNAVLGAELGLAAAFFAELQSKQEPLGFDFAKVLYENLWDLYES